MKINKSLKGLFLGLAVSGVLLAGGMSAYAPAHCFAEGGQLLNRSTPSDEEFDEKIKKVVDEKFTTGVDEKIKTAVDNKVENIANERFKGIVEDKLNNKADWYVLYFSVLALVLGVCGTGLAIFSMDKASDANNKRIKSINKLEQRCSDLQEKIENLNKRIVELDNKNGTLQQQFNVLDSRARKSREAEYKYEINNHAPIPSDNDEFFGSRRTIGMKEEPKPSDAELMNREHEGIMSEYASLMRSWRSGDQASYRRNRKAFQDKYGVVEFSCTNEAQRITSNEAPIFKTNSSKGVFWAIASKVNKKIFFVYPSASLTYENQAHTTGGMKEAFNSNYYPGIQSGSDFSVEKPALFVQADDEWHVCKKGTLTFK